MAIGDLLNRLETVRRRGPGRWIARCPAHEDKHPSLSIREIDDGRLLVHCFAGCSIEDVMAAVGSSTSALFHDRPDPGNSKDPKRHRIHARDVLACLVLETLIVADCARTVARGEALSETDARRLTEAVARIARAAEIANAF